MNWQRLHDELYYADGTWRDIYVNEATEEDWRKWVIFVNDNFQVEFYNGLKSAPENQIDFNAVLDRWAGKTHVCNHVIIIFSDIKFNCHFFTTTNIEIDFDPEEINFVADHEVILKYMSDFSRLLCKKVVMTPENLPNQPCISVSNGIVEIITD